MSALLVDLGWKSALLAALVLLGWGALRGRAAGERVLWLRLGIGALLALPLLALAGPSLELAVLPAEEIAVATPIVAEPVADLAAAPVADGIDWLLVLYAIGAGLVLLRLAFGLVTLLRWTRAATPVADPRWTSALARASRRIARPVRLLASPKIDAPLSWGVAPAWILIGPATEQQGGQADAVLAHEMAHVRRFDWPMLMLAQLATALLWFNPLVWWIGRALAAQIELAADEDAVAEVARADYAHTLLSVGAGQAHRSACGMTYAHSTLGQRIRQVLEGGPKRPASRMLSAAMLVAAVAIAGPLGALRLVPAEAQAMADPVAAQISLPAIIPQAEARDVPQSVEVPPRAQAKPMPRKRRKPNAPAVAPAPVARAKATTLTGDPAWFLPPRQIHAPHAVKPWAGLPPEVQAKIVAAGKPPRPSKPGTDVVALREAAQGLRVKAAVMERIAADPNVASEVRAAHARTAGALHRTARQMEKDAKQLRKQS